MLFRLGINTLLRYWIKPLWNSAASIERVRRVFALADRIGAIGRAVPQIEQARIDGVYVEWIGSAASASHGLILYLHGGAFSVRAPLADRRFCADLSLRTGLPVLLAAYQLAPEARFPAGLDDCCRVYEALLQRGVPAQRIVLVGHSAGANLALVLMMRARKRQLPQAAGAVLLSPITDFTASGASVMRNARRDVFMTPEIWLWAAAHYVSQAALNDPELSPLFGDWTGLPALAFHVSGSEMLLDDSLRAVACAQKSGTDATVTVWNDVPHNFPSLDFLPEAKRCRALIAAFVCERLGLPDSYT